MASQPTYSAVTAEAVTPNDSTNLTFLTRMVYVGGEGNLAVEFDSGDTATFAVAAGAQMPLAVRKVLSTGTTATSIVACY